MTDLDFAPLGKALAELTDRELDSVVGQLCTVAEELREDDGAPRLGAVVRAVGVLAAEEADRRRHLIEELRVALMGDERGGLVGRDCGPFDD